MNDSTWAGVLMVTVAVLIAVGFLSMWIRDRGRAREQASDVERMDTEPQLGSHSREGAADMPHPTHRERRH
jgi:hypothetical protein